MGIPGERAGGTSPAAAGGVRSMAAGPAEPANVLADGMLRGRLQGAACLSGFRGMSTHASQDAPAAPRMFGTLGLEPLAFGSVDSS